MNKIILKPKSDRRVGNGHHWIFSNELTEVPKFEAGTIVDVYSYNNSYFGKAFFNPKSLIAARLLFTKKEIDFKFIKSRIQKAYEYRMKLFKNEDSFRLCFGESDFLPGLVIDKYGDYLSVQMLSAGIDKLKNEVYKALLEILPETKGIIEKNVNMYRELEGLEQSETVVFGNIPENIIINELGLKFNISLLDSQKTGYYFDQKQNRFALRNLSEGLNVLDCFCNQGGFALNTAKANSSHSLGIDVSESAINSATKNAELNGLPNCTFQKADVFDFLKLAIDKNKKWDMIILDPPAFAKSRKAIPTAIKGYAKINKMALQLLNNGGYLVTSSCSQLINEEVFYETISNVASKLQISLKLVFRGGQSADHPVISSMPETKYLKFFIFYVEKAEKE